jgi:hypothetical protein
VPAAASAAPPNPVETAEKDVADKVEKDATQKANMVQARADAFKNPPDSQKPEWSDLIFNETAQKADAPACGVGFADGPGAAID